MSFQAFQKVKLVYVWSELESEGTQSEALNSAHCALIIYIQLVHIEHRSRNVRKRTFGHVRPVKIQISLRISAVWSESSLGAFRIAKDAKFLYADNEDWPYCAEAQADLSLRWAHMSEGAFPHVAVYIDQLVFHTWWNIGV